MSRESCDMVLHPDYDTLFNETRPVGTFAWQERDGVRWICMKLPPEAGWCQIPVRPVPDGFAGATWEWDGNVEKPTLSPSVLVTHRRPDGSTQEDWHGFIRAGRAESC